MKFPRSPYDKEGGLVYFPRMLDKIRMHLAGKLGNEYVPLLGKGFDGRCCRFLGVAYEAVVEKVKQGCGDTEILIWCRANGRSHDEEEILVWNSFMTKRAWRDEDPAVQEKLDTFKREAGLEHRDDILTYFDFFEVDEKRKP